MDHLSTGCVLVCWSISEGFARKWTRKDMLLMWTPIWWLPRFFKDPPCFLAITCGKLTWLHPLWHFFLAPVLFFLRAGSVNLIFWNPSPLFAQHLEAFKHGTEQTRTANQSAWSPIMRWSRTRQIISCHHQFRREGTAISSGNRKFQHTRYTIHFIWVWWK